MKDNILYKFSQNVAIVPSFFGFYLQSDHLHPIVSLLRLIKKDIPYARGRFVDFDLGAHNEENIKLIRSMVGEIDDFIDSYICPRDNFNPIDFYGMLPTSLKGNIELISDFFNRPTFRLIGRADNYSPVAQDGYKIGLYEKKMSSDWRVWRPDQDCFWIKKSMPGSYLYSVLSEIAETGMPKRQIEDLLETQFSEDDFERLFTVSKNRTGDARISNELRINYVNHACVLLQYKGISVLIDPLLSESEFNFSSLPETIEYVLFTHNHYDHVDIRTLIRLKSRVKHVFLPSSSHLQWDYSLKLVFEKLGFSDVVVQDYYDSVSLLPDVEVISLPFLGEHCELPQPKSSWGIRAGGKSVIFFADSRFYDADIARNIPDEYKTPDAIFIGTCNQGSPVDRAYPHLVPKVLHDEFDRARTTAGAGAEEIFNNLIKIINPKSVYVYALGYEKWLESFLGQPVLDYGEEAALLERFIAKDEAVDSEFKVLVNDQFIVI